MESWQKTEADRALEDIACRGLLVGAIETGEAIQSLAFARARDLTRLQMAATAISIFLEVHAPDVRAVWTYSRDYRRLVWVLTVTGGHERIREQVSRLIQEGVPLVVGGVLATRPPEPPALGTPDP